MKNEFFTLSIVLISVILIAGCVSEKAPSKEENLETLKQKCIQACENAVEKGKDLSNGPCILDPMENEDWVCDVAHEPRQPVDNQRKNQCDAWHSGKAKHFIEVTPTCEFIKAR